MPRHFKPIKKAIVRTIYGKLVKKETLKHPTKNIWWKFVMQAFEERIAKKGDDECWKWKGSSHRQGFGMINVSRFENNNRKGGNMNAQRLAKAIDIGRALTKDERVIATCHKKDCTNPKHLIIGNRSDAIRMSPACLKYYNRKKRK